MASRVTLLNTLLVFNLVTSRGFPKTLVLLLITKNTVLLGVFLRYSIAFGLIDRGPSKGTTVRTLEGDKSRSILIRLT